MQFGPNNTANLKGRPRGRPDKRSKFRRMFEHDAEEVVRKVLEMAKGGNLDACKLVLERCAPKLRDEVPRRRLALEGETLEGLGRSVVAAISNGELAPDEGAALLNGLARQGELEKLGVLGDMVAKLLADRGLPVPPELDVRRRIPATLDQGAAS
jgi:hypothetical protein